MARIASALTLLAVVMTPVVAARRASNTGRHQTKAQEQEQDTEQLTETQSLPVEVFHALKTHFRRPPPLPRPAGRILPSHVRPYSRPQGEPQPPRTPVPSPPTHLDTTEVLAMKEPVPEFTSPKLVVAEGDLKQEPQTPSLPESASPMLVVADENQKQEPNTPYPPPFTYPPPPGLALSDPFLNPVPEVQPDTPYTSPFTSPSLAVADGNLKQEPPVPEANKPVPTRPEVPPNKPSPPQPHIVHAEPRPHILYADAIPKPEPQPFQPSSSTYIFVPPYPPHPADPYFEKFKPTSNTKETRRRWFPSSLRPEKPGGYQALMAGAALYAAHGSTPAPEEADADAAQNQPHALEHGSQALVIANPEEAWRPWNWIQGLLGPTVAHDESDAAKADDEESTSWDETQDSHEDPHDEDDSAADIFYSIEPEDWNPAGLSPGFTEDWNSVTSQDDSDAPSPSDSSADEQQLQGVESEEDLSDMFYRTDETMDW